MSLLTKAKKVPIGRQGGTRTYMHITKDVVDLSVAWARGDVKLTQVREVIGPGKSHSYTYAILAQGLREYVRKIT